jgi:hypothetical protein
MSTPETLSDIEDVLRAALTARAELVQPEDLAPLAPVVELRPRWRSPWVLLATAAVVLLILGVVFQGLDSRPTSDRLAPKPDAPRLELPADVGRDWKAVDQSTPARLDLDGDGAKETVTFLGEKTKNFDGRIRLQTTLSTTGEESYGIAELGTTIGTTALGPIDADDDGDQELVLWYDDLGAVGGGGYPLVFDLRDGLLVRAAVEDADLLVRGNVPVPGEATGHYEMVRIHDYRVEGGRLMSSRSVNAFASAGMTLFRPESIVVDTWEWELDRGGVLRPVEAGCRVLGPESVTQCAPGQVDDPPVVSPVATETIGVGESAEFSEGYRFRARLEAVADPSLVVEGDDGRTLRHGLEVADPRVSTVQPMSIFYDGASVVVTSVADPTYLQVLVQDGDELRALHPVGEVALANEADVRTWLTRNGALVTVVAAEDGTWGAWQWVMVSRTEMAAFPTGTVCFEDVEDPSTVRSC